MLCVVLCCSGVQSGGVKCCFCYSVELLSLSLSLSLEEVPFCLAHVLHGLCTAVCGRVCGLRCLPERPNTPSTHADIRPAVRPTDRGDYAAAGAPVRVQNDTHTQRNEICSYQMGSLSQTVHSTQYTAAVAHVRVQNNTSHTPLLFECRMTHTHTKE